MRRLFWRIFGLFWAATVVLIIAIAVDHLDNFENEKLPVHRRHAHGSGAQRRAAQRAARVPRKRRGSDEAARGATCSASASRCTCSTPTTHDLLGRDVPPEVLDAGRIRCRTAKASTTTALRVRKINSTDGKPHLHGVASFTGSPLLRMLYRRPNTFWMHVAVAMVISAVFSLLLAAYITAPLARIRSSARRVARGDLSARVGDLPFGRSAEILALANEFDQMAARLKELVEGQQRLIRDVSHEMRSPLSRLRVAIELAREHSKPATTRAARPHRARIDAAGGNDRPVDPAFAHGNDDADACGNHRARRTRRRHRRRRRLRSAGADRARCTSRKARRCSVHAEADLLDQRDRKRRAQRGQLHLASAAPSTCAWTASKTRRACA